MRYIHAHQARISGAAVTWHFPRRKYAVMLSYGNDGIAVLQYLRERFARVDGYAVFSDTKWAAPPSDGTGCRCDACMMGWMSRVEKAEGFAREIGLTPVRIESEGMEALTLRKKAFPMDGMAFCSYELKIRPAKEWLYRADPERRLICVVGVRGAESAKRRRTWAEWQARSQNHGWRSLWAPLFHHSTRARNELVERAGWYVIPHRSRECAPCINLRPRALAHLEENVIERLAKHEARMGVTSNGHPRVMFRSEKHVGASGIRAVVEEAPSLTQSQLSLSALDPDQSDCWQLGFCGEA